MARKLKTSEATIRELFAHPGSYSIPAYQREYAWEGEEARRLIEDVHSAMLDAGGEGGGNPYFLGSILLCNAPTAESVEPVPADAGSRLANVVDGQQRLLTLAIVFACLRDKLKRPDLGALLQGPGGSKLVLRAADQDFFERIVQAPGATNRDRGEKPGVNASATHKNILKNRNVLRQYLRTIGDAECTALADFLADHCNIVRLEADDEDYAYQIFLSINERGKDLTVEDIFQAEIIGPLDCEEQTKYKAIIDQVGRFGLEGRKNVARAKTFFSHMAAAQGWPNSRMVSAIRKRIREAGGPQGFKTAVFTPMAAAYMGALGLAAPQRELTPAARSALENLQLLETHGDDDWIATAMLALLRLDDPTTLESVIAELDRCAHVMAALGFGGTRRKKKYAAINDLLRNGEPPAALLAAMGWTPQDEVQAVRKIAQKLHISDDGTCRLFLFRIDAALSGRPISCYREMAQFALKHPDRFSVEHIIPKAKKLKPQAEEAWGPLFKSSAHRQLCAQFIGNLALVPLSENRDADQQGFADKKAILLGADPHPIHTTEMLRQASAWTLDELSERHRLMMEAALELWRLPGPITPPPRGLPPLD